MQWARRVPLWGAALVILTGIGIAPAATVDRTLLPETAHYTRNASCSAVQVVAPTVRPHTHPLDNKISPNPAASAMSQGDSAICFAYATADMISQRVGVTVSALDVATQYYFADANRLAALPSPALRRYLREHPQTVAEILEDRNDEPPRDFRRL